MFTTKFYTLFLLLNLSLFLIGCTEKVESTVIVNNYPIDEKFLDNEQIKHSAIKLADNWLIYGNQSNGFQKTNYFQDWQATNKNNRVSLTSQARLVYVYAISFEISHNIKYLNAATNAADFMVAYMRNEENNSWYYSVDHKGLNAITKQDPYAYSFVIFALSHVYKVSGDTHYKKLALLTLSSNIWPGLKYARNYYNSGEVSEYNQKKIWYQNPYMHLFEALISLYEITNYPEVLADLEQMANLIDEQVMPSCNCIPEYINAYNMTPQFELKGSTVEIGHQIEWAFLLNKAVDVGLNIKYRSTAQRLLDFSLEYGLNTETGGLMATTKLNGEIIRNKYEWWAQAELMRATLYYIEKLGRKDLLPIYLQTFEFSKKNFIDGDGSWNATNVLLNQNEELKIKKVIGYHAMAYYSFALSL